jgi:hypothetical protein
MAARFLAAAARVRELTGAPLFAQWRKAEELANLKTRDTLGDAFEAAQREGAEARFEDVAAEARRLLAEMARAQSSRTGARSPSGS